MFENHGKSTVPLLKENNSNSNLNIHPVFLGVPLLIHVVSVSEFFANSNLSMATESISPESKLLLFMV